MNCSCVHSKNIEHHNEAEQTVSDEVKQRKAANCRRDKLRRCIYDGSETDQQRENRLIKQRERSQKNLASKTTEEKSILKERKNRRKRERRLADTSNQKFWRLLRRRQYYKFGLHIHAVNFEYYRSKHQYGIDMDFASDDESVVGVSDVGMKTMFDVFNEMVELALAGRSIPLESFKMFDHYGIYMPDNFFTCYVADLSYNKLIP